MWIPIPRFAIRGSTRWARALAQGIAAFPRGLVAMLSTWRGRAITAFVLLQLLLPLAYLTRKDPHDERFAWRMFSPMRMARCVPSATIDDKPYNLYGTFHEAWLELASRGRFAVVQAMGAKLCADNPGKRVRLQLDCTYIDREPRTYGGYDMCSVPEL